MTSQDLSSLKLGFIGGGNMASAIGVGLIKKGVLKADNIWVSGKTERTFTFWNDLGVHTTLKNGEVVQNSDVIFLTIKPQMLDDALKGMKDTLTGDYAMKDIQDTLNDDDASTVEEKNRLFISVLVGVTMETLQRKLDSILHKPRVIRAMPSTPACIGEGITVFCSNQQNPSDESLASKLFSYIGISEIVAESQINAIGALAGSGPAYAFLITEALADGAVRMGVPRAMATRFAAQVLVGAGKMVLETGRHPGQLKDEVCSPGGTTITGVHALERGGVRGSLMNAIEAAVTRSEELSSAQKK